MTSRARIPMSFWTWHCRPGKCLSIRVLNKRYLILKYLIRLSHIQKCGNSFEPTFAICVSPIAQNICQRCSQRRLLSHHQNRLHFSNNKYFRPIQIETGLNIGKNKCRLLLPAVNTKTNYVLMTASLLHIHSRRCVLTNIQHSAFVAKQHSCAMFSFIEANLLTLKRVKWILIFFNDFSIFFSKFLLIDKEKSFISFHFNSFLFRFISFQRLAAPPQWYNHWQKWLWVNVKIL